MFTWSVTAASSPTATAPSSSTPPSAGTPVVALTRPPPQYGRVGVARRLAIQGTDSHHLALAYRATGLPAGLKINSSSGVISGTPKRAARTSVTVTATDGAGSSGATAFSWTIAGAPRVRTSSLRLGRDGHVRLSLSLVAGAHAAPIRTLIVSLPRTARLTLTPADRIRGVYTVSHTGARLANSSHLLHAALVVRLKKTARSATIRLSPSELSFSRQLIAGLTTRRGQTVRLFVTATDSAGIRSRLVVHATVDTKLA